MNKKISHKLFSNWIEKILALVSAVFIFLFYRTIGLKEKTLTVPVRIILNEKMVPASVYPQTISVHVKTEPEKIDAVTESDIDVSADFSSYAADGTYTVPLVLKKKDILKDAKPGSASMQLEIGKKMIKILPIKPILTGTPPFGHEVFKTTLIPSSIQIESTIKHLKNITMIETEAIDISSYKDDFSLMVRLNQKNPFIRYPSGNVVEFRCQMRQNLMVRLYNAIPITVLSLKQDFYIASELPKVSARIQGTQTLISNLDLATIPFTIDCKEIEQPGIYELPITAADFNPGVQIIEFFPNTAAVEIQIKKSTK